MRLIKIFIIIIVYFYSFPSLAFEYTYTLEKDRCLVANRPNALEIGNALAYGTAISNSYSFILDNKTYKDSFYPQPTDLAYAFFLIADKIGDSDANKKINWISAYTPPEDRAIVNYIINSKFSEEYLQKCFSAKGNIQNISNPQSDPIERVRKPRIREMTDEQLYKMFIMDNGQ